MGNDSKILSANRNRSLFMSMILIVAGLAITGAGVAAMLHAAPNASAATTLTITLDASRTLSKEPGIRLARVTSNDGQTCFRASRRLAGTSGTINETFCTH